MLREMISLFLNNIDNSTKRKYRGKEGKNATILLFPTPIF